MLLLSGVTKVGQGLAPAVKQIFCGGKPPPYTADESESAKQTEQKVFCSAAATAAKANLTFKLNLPACGTSLALMSRIYVRQPASFKLLTFFEFTLFPKVYFLIIITIIHGICVLIK